MRPMPFVLVFLLACASAGAQVSTIFTCNSPQDVEVDGAGNVYVTCTAFGQVFRISPGGVSTQLLDATGGGLAPFNANAPPFSGSFVDMALDGSVLYIAAPGSNNVFRIDNGMMPPAVSVVATPGITTPTAVAVDSNGDLYVSGAGSDNVIKIADPGGTQMPVTTVIDATGAGGTALAGPVDIALDAQDNVYVASRATFSIFKITAGGTASLLTTGLGAGPNGPSRLAIHGNILFATAPVPSTTTIAVRIDTTSGVPTALLTSAGDGVNPATNALGIAADGFGNAYVACRGSDNAFRIDAGGSITQILAPTGDGTTMVGQPIDVTARAQGDVFVADNFGNVVWKIGATSLGTGDDLVTQYGINGAPMITAGGSASACLTPGDTLAICHSSLGGTFVNVGSVVIVGSVRPNGMPFPTVFPGLHIQLSSAFLVLPDNILGASVQLPASGICYNVFYPTGLMISGNDVLIQCIIGTTLASNNIFASTNGLKMKLL